MASKSQDGYYSQYKAAQKWKSNREAKLLKQLKLQPNNATQIEAAMGNISYRRKKPETSIWSSSNRRVAQLLKEFCGRCPHAVFSSNQKLAAEVLQNLWRDPKPHELPQGKVDFSLGARLQGAR